MSPLKGASHKMIAQCKTNMSIEEKEKFNADASSYIKAMLQYGRHTKTFLDGNDPEYDVHCIPPDTDIAGTQDTSRDEYNVKQLHLQRFLILDHASVRTKFYEARVNFCRYTKDK